MKHKIIFGKGKRNENQDDLCPKPSKDNSQIYVVCDGVGGAAFGKEAAQITSQAVHTYLSRTKELSLSGINMAINYAEEGLDIFKSQNKQASSMSTTLSVLLFHKDKAYGAWVGDSRIYHLRDKKIIYKSQDHSLGKMLVSKGLISSTSLKYFPYKNVITRGITGSSQKSLADTVEFNNIQPEDYFMVCTDGFHNNLKKEHIDLFHPKQDMHFLHQELTKSCLRNCTDNYACHLIKIP